MELLTKIRRRLGRTLLDPIARGVIDDRLTYLPLEKVRRLNMALRETAKVAGDIIEFGVALGGSGIMMAQHTTAAKRYIGFDVFGMIPPPTSDKDDAKSRERYEFIASGKSKGLGNGDYYGYRSDLLSDVKEAFHKYGVSVDGTKVLLVEGLFENTWGRVPVDSIALAHVDCDWYDPVKFVLSVSADKVSPGGILVIDDYNDYNGCRTAVDEFLKERNDFTFSAGENPFLRKKVQL